MEKIFVSVFMMIFVTCYPFSILAQASIQTVSIERVMIGINTKRTEAKLPTLKMDNDLCILAQKLAEDSEKSYPKEVIITENPEYMNFLKNYSSYKTSKVTYNDALVKAAKGDKSFLKMDENFLTSSFVLKDKVATSPELTHACVGVSPGDVGYKPFAFFVGGVRKVEVETRTSLNFKDILDEIMSFIRSMLSKKH